jgi:uncharacterized metal-binding protein YceD (DUF177 family)
MNIALPAFEANKIYEIEIFFNKNLPNFIENNFSIKAQYSINYKPGLLQPLLNINIDGILSIFCERCGKQYLQPFKHDFLVAICQNDAEADAIMADYDPVIATNNEIDLAHIVLDEIILTCPRKHVKC